MSLPIDGDDERGADVGRNDEFAPADAGGVPLDPTTGEPYWVAALERQFAKADAARAERERLLRLRELEQPRARRRSYRSTWASRWARHRR